MLKSEPRYRQVKEQVARQIREGKWQTGDRLPTERELAAQLSVSRNTVAQAYRELEAEGWLVSWQGRGTFVADIDQMQRAAERRTQLIRRIDALLEESFELGFTLDELLDLVKERASEQASRLATATIYFVECNREQADYFSKQLHQAANVRIEPMLLEEVRKATPEVCQRLERAVLVITTFFHLDEVRRLMAGRDAQVLGIALDPKLSTITKVARIPTHKRIGLVCLSQNFAYKVRAALQAADLEISFDLCISRESDEVKRFVDAHDALLVSPSRLREVSELAARHQPVIEFQFVPDRGSANALHAALVELGHSAGRIDVQVR